MAKLSREGRSKFDGRDPIHEIKLPAKNPKIFEEGRDFCRRLPNPFALVVTDDGGGGCDDDEIGKRMVKIRVNKGLGEANWL
ncbi:hypothetical protein SLEP1_g58336 [Rubroshorea leprosula]|uniref:Uncharacterized protein n=1 Tax=Rubroshorea leprosula TaxID=152421 RepID=A0AAV5MQ73_9ROSI|nr:hypothetical protein SLEP1_g58336 [Rubroshorea leprosula]